MDILITATDSYVPVPSMSAMIANRFKMRSDVRTYSLAGHTCTSGIIVVELAQQLLKVPALCSLSAGRVTCCRWRHHHL